MLQELPPSSHQPDEEQLPYIPSHDVLHHLTFLPNESFITLIRPFFREDRQDRAERIALRSFKYVRLHRKERMFEPYIQTLPDDMVSYDAYEKYNHSLDTINDHTFSFTHVRGVVSPPKTASLALPPPLRFQFQLQPRRPADLTQLARIPRFSYIKPRPSEEELPPQTNGKIDVFLDIPYMYRARPITTQQKEHLTIALEGLKTALTHNEEPLQGTRPLSASRIRLEPYRNDPFQYYAFIEQETRITEPPEAAAS